MPGHVPEFLEELDAIKRNLGKTSSGQLNSQIQRNGLRALVEKYFESIRPLVLEESELDQDVENLDSNMQELLLLCHKRGMVKAYLSLLKNIRKDLILIDARVVTSTPKPVKPQEVSELDAHIVSTLEKIVPSAALSYKQALLDLKEERRYSWRGPATDLRESLRETLDHLAPDADVINMPGYKKIADTNGPTMKQKVRFILKSRGASKAISTPAEAATESVEEAVGTFVRSVYTRSSISTHTPTEKGEVTRIRDFVRVILCELLEVHA